MAVPSFLFGGSTNETPQSIKQKRDLVRAIMGASSAPRNIGEGLNALGDGIVANVLDRRANKAEEAGQSAANSLFNSIIGGSSSPPGATGSAMPAATSSSADGPSSYRDAIASIESAGSGDYSAVGPTNPKLGRALGRYQVMEANIGPWSKEALGREVTPDEFLANPQLQDAIFDKKFGGYVQQYGPQGAAQAWFAGPGGVGKLDRKDSLGTNVAAYGDKFNRAVGGDQVASLDPSVGMPQQPAQKPYVDPQVTTAYAQPAPVANTPAAQAIQQQAPALPPPTTVATPPSPPQQPMQPQVQQPVQVAQNNAFGGVDPRLLQALQNPWLNEGQKAAVQLLIQQQQRQAEQSAEQETWKAREDYKLNSQRADPAYKLEQDYKQAQLDALKAKTGKRANVTNLGDGWLYDNDKGEAFRPQDEVDRPGGGFRFGGNSVEAQALNGLIDSRQITADQAQQLGAGKTITDPSTGAMMFLTPQGIFKQQGQQQPAPQQQSVDLFGENAQQPPQGVDLFGPSAAAAPSASAPVPAAQRQTPTPGGANNGIIPLTAGKPSNQLTESERKNRSLYSVVKPELSVVETNFDALSDPKNQAYSRLPFSEFATTPEYQKAANSLQTIVSSYLYSVSGATATRRKLGSRPTFSHRALENRRSRSRTRSSASGPW
ncbi:hypothetical protein LPB79_13240 [Rhizobium sp. T136]|uniref:hypothetical protein n=1 Tax=Rhizobium sp. T136 TaxID=555319 RepID=UPI001E4CC973|nr:hypothetical protein [Rhizobium sp. T136]UFS83212.1 hypothetical protein LPB79_13240 [Rhizobium sp. T136]